MTFCNWAVVVVALVVYGLICLTIGFALGAQDREWAKKRLGDE